MAVLVNEWEYGANSPVWMAKALLAYVPRPNLNNAINTLLERADDEALLTEDEIRQTLVQIAATGHFFETFSPEDDMDETLGGEQGTDDGLPSKAEVDNILNNWKIDAWKQAQQNEEDENGDDNEDA